MPNSADERYTTGAPAAWARSVALSQGHAPHEARQWHPMLWGGHDCAPMEPGTLRADDDGAFEVLLAGRWVKVDEGSFLYGRATQRKPRRRGRRARQREWAIWRCGRPHCRRLDVEPPRKSYA